MSFAETEHYLARLRRSVDAKRAARVLLRESEERVEGDLAIAIGVAVECATCAGLGKTLVAEGETKRYGEDGVEKTGIKIVVWECGECRGTGAVDRRSLG